MTPDEIRKQMMGSAGVDAAPQSQLANPRCSRPALAWTHMVHMMDKRVFVTDGSLLIDASYVSIPETALKTAPESTVLSLLGVHTEHMFSFDTIEDLGNERFCLPNGALLNGDYVMLLSQIKPKGNGLSLGASGPLDVILLIDDSQAIGAVMPMRP